MNRGSPLSRCGPRRWRGRFNEAPIHESGKYESALDPCLVSGRFNEAPIHESGPH